MKKIFARLHTRYRRNIASARQGESESWRKKAGELVEARLKGGKGVHALQETGQVSYSEVEMAVKLLLLE